VCETTAVQHAWERGQPLAVHGWIYAVSDGLLRDLGVCVAGPDELIPAHRAAVLAGSGHGAKLRSELAGGELSTANIRDAARPIDARSKSRT